MKKVSCEDCAWWNRFYKGDDVNQSIGDCMRHPPTAESTISKTVPVEGIREVYFHRGIFPCTRPTDYCGEHTKAKVSKDEHN